jgi:hypothetical protein
MCPNMIPVRFRSRQILPLMPSMSAWEMPFSIALKTPLEIDGDLCGYELTGRLQSPDGSQTRSTPIPDSKRL